MKKIGFVIWGMLLLGCQDIQRPEKPENLIPEETMVSLLSEIYLGNAARSINNKHIRERGIKLDSFLFAKYKVDSLQFVKSNEYYAANVDTYNSIIGKVTRYLEHAKNEENDKRLAQDSIRQANMKDTLINKANIQKADTNEKNGLLDTAMQCDSIE